MNTSNTSKRMSEVLGIISNNWNSVNLSGKGIRIIDAITNANKIKNLNLSANSLSSLAGMKQFINLSHLNFSDNQIQSINDLSPLRELKCLRWINLSGNPVQRQPNYTATLLQFLPNLLHIDGRIISQGERKELIDSLSIQQILLDQLLNNYLRLISLQSAVRKIQVHQELLSCYEPEQQPQTPPFDIEQFERFFNLRQNLDSSIIQELQINLIQDSILIQQQISEKDNLAEGLQELLHRQKQKEQLLIEDIERLVNDDYIKYYSKQQLQLQLQANQSTGNNSFVERQSPSIMKQSRGFSSDKKISRQQSSTQGQGLHPLSSSFIKVHQQMSIQSTPETVKHSTSCQLTRMLSSSTRNFPNQIKHAQSLPFSHFGEGKQMQPQQQSQQNSSSYLINRSDRNNQFSNSLQSFNKITKIKDFSCNPSTSMGLRSCDKDILINQLSESLNNKICEVVKMEDMNQRLRVEIQDQIKNAHNSNGEMDSIIKEKDTQLSNYQEQLKLLESQLKEFRAKTNVLQLQTSEIERFKREKVRAEQKLSQVENAIIKGDKLEDKEEKMLANKKKKLLSFWFTLLKTASKKQRKIRLFTKKVDQKILNVQGREVLRQWHRKSKIDKQVKQMQISKQLQLQKDHFKLWKTNSKFIHNFKLYQQTNKRMLLSYFASFKQALVNNTKYQQLKKIAFKHKRNNLFRKGFKALLSNFKLYSRGKKEDNQRENQVISDRIQNIRRKILFKWRDYIRIDVKNKKQQYHDSQVHCNHTRILKVFNGLRQQRQLRQTKQLRAIQMDNRNIKRFLGRVFRKWCIDIILLNKSKRYKQAQAIAHYKNKILMRLKKGAQMSKLSTQLQNARAEQLLQSLLVKAFKALKTYQQISKKDQKRCEEVIKCKQQKELRRLFIGLRNHKKEMKRLKGNEKTIQLKIQKKFALEWSRVAKKRISLVQKEKAINEQLNHRNITTFQQSFFQWKYIVKRKHRNSRIIQAIVLRRQRSIFSALVNGVKSKALEYLKKNCIQQDILLKSMSGSVQDGQKQVNEYENRTIECNHKIQLLTENIEYLRQELEEKNISIEQYRQLELSHNQQIDQLSTQLLYSEQDIQQTQQQMNYLDSKLIEISEKHQQELGASKAEIEQLKLTKELLTDSFNQKEKELIDKYGTLTVKNSSQDNYIQRLERIKSELETKVQEQEEFEAAQKQENVDLLVVVSNFEKERQEYKEKIEQCLSIVDQSSQVYEKKLLELQQEKNEKDTQNAVLSEKNKLANNQIEQLHAQLARLQYEVETLVGDAHKQTATFINNLNNPINMPATYNNPSTPNNTNNISNIIHNDSNRISSNNFTKKPFSSHLEYAPLSSDFSLGPLTSYYNNNNINSTIPESPGVRASLNSQQDYFNRQENQLFQQVSNIQDFLKPRKTEVSPLKSYLSTRSNQQLQQLQQQQPSALYSPSRASQVFSPKNAQLIYSPSMQSQQQQQQQYQQQQQNKYQPIANKNYLSSVIPNQQSIRQSLTAQYQQQQQEESSNSSASFNNRSQNVLLRDNNNSNNAVQYENGRYIQYRGNIDTQNNLASSSNKKIDSIQSEVRNMKANTSALKSSIERRLQNLNSNLDTDFINMKQQRLQETSQRNDFE